MENKNGFISRELSAQDIPQILRLQDIVFANLENTDFLRYNTENMYQECFRLPTISRGYFAGDDLVGMTIFVDCHGTSEDLSQSLQKFSASRPINCKVVLVHPDYRGRHWQKEMFLACEAIARNKGYKQIIATVARDNSHSRNNLISLGMKLDSSTTKYGGLQRDIMYKSIIDGGALRPKQCY